MNPSWYDVLGVEQDATDDEIRAAWKASVADLEPTDRRFKQRNRAAEVLLDPERRAAHDLDLADELDDDEVEGDVEVPADHAETASDVGDHTVIAPLTPDKPGGTGDTDEPGATGEPGAVAPTAAPSPARVGLSLALGLLALLLVVATVTSFVTGIGGPGGSGDGSDDDLPDASQIAAAQAAASTAIVPILSYDYRDIEASQAAARPYLTKRYAAEYDQFTDVVAENAPRTKTIVTTEVVSSGVVRTGVGRVDVLLFVNRPTKNATKDEVYRDQVTVRMLDEDGGGWLVDCLITSTGGTCGD